MTLSEYLSKSNETPTAFALRSGVAQSVISRMLNGKTWPRPDTIDVIVKASGKEVSASELYAAYLDARAERAA